MAVYIILFFFTDHFPQSLICFNLLMFQITIIIKGGSTPCTSEKTYEATSESPSLPSSFTDDTSGSESVVLTRSLDDPSSPTGHQRVEIYIRYIETTLVIRRAGKYLAFSAKIPQEITKYSINSESNGQQLCSKGCPKKERMNMIAERGHFVSREEALEKCRRTEELSNDISNQLTDNYLDWCIFDVMTAGSKSADDFVVAAHSAQADVLRFDPTSLKNRTTLLETDSTVMSSASPLLRIHLATVSVIFAILFLFS